jgi:lipopolysaccharide transport protein LptA
MERVEVVSPEEVSATEVRVASTQDPGFEVEAPRSRWDMNGRVAVFEGGVTARRGDFQMECAQMEIRYREDGELESATATGEIRIRRPPWTASGDTASIDLAEGTIALHGSARITNGQHHMRGERILLAMDEETIDCTDCVVEIGPGAVEREE